MICFSAQIIQQIYACDKTEETFAVFHDSDKVPAEYGHQVIKNFLDIAKWV